jgi:hypothetical protein
LNFKNLIGGMWRNGGQPFTEPFQETEIKRQFYYGHHTAPNSKT